MGVLVGPDSETQVGGCFSLRTPLLPSFGVTVLGEESAEGDCEDLNLGAQPAGQLGGGGVGSRLPLLLPEPLTL